MSDIDKFIRLAKMHDECFHKYMTFISIFVTLLFIYVFFCGISNHFNILDADIIQLLGVIQLILIVVTSFFVVISNVECTRIWKEIKTIIVEEER